MDRSSPQPKARDQRKRRISKKDVLELLRAEIDMYQRSHRDTETGRIRDPDVRRDISILRRALQIVRQSA